MSYGTTIDIQCGESIKDIASAEEPISLRFKIKDYEQDISLIDSIVTFIPVLKIKDSKGSYAKKVTATDCVKHECDGQIYAMTAVPLGSYTVDMIPNDKGGTFKVAMVCSGTFTTTFPTIDSRDLLNK